MASDVFITGDKKLDKKLQELGATLAKKYMRKATREVAKDVLKDARSRVRVKTGKLRKSLKVRAMKRRGRMITEIGHVITTGEDLFKGDTFYGGFLEFGWAPLRGSKDSFGQQKNARRRARYQRRKERTTRGAMINETDSDRVRGYPFLRPALYTKQGERLKMFVTAMRQFVEAENKTT